MTRGEIGLAQEGRWGGRATNEENNTGERERQEERRGEGGRRKGGEIDERSEREREKKGAYGF